MSDTTLIKRTLYQVWENEKVINTFKTREEAMRFQALHSVIQRFTRNAQAFGIAPSRSTPILHHVKDLFVVANEERTYTDPLRLSEAAADHHRSEMREAFHAFINLL